MRLTITINYAAETKKELIDEFGSTYELMKQHIVSQRNAGVFGAPSKVVLRHVITGGRTFIEGVDSKSFEAPERPVLDEEQDHEEIT